MWRCDVPKGIATATSAHLPAFATGAYHHDLHKGSRPEWGRQAEHSCGKQSDVPRARQHHRKLMLVSDRSISDGVLSCIANGNYHAILTKKFACCLRPRECNGKHLSLIAVSGRTVVQFGSLSCVVIWESYAGCFSDSPVIGRTRHVRFAVIVLTTMLVSASRRWRSQRRTCSRSGGSDSEGLPASRLTEAP